MAKDYFCTEGIPQNHKNMYYTEVESKNSHGRLQEMQCQLTKAESRCKNLKKQLDYMKKLYQDTSNDNLRKKRSNPKRSSHVDSQQKLRVSSEQKLGKFYVNRSTEVSPVRSDGSLTPHKEENTSKQHTQIKNFIDIPCTQTLQSMFSTITESVNRVTDTQCHIDNSKPIRSTIENRQGKTILSSTAEMLVRKNTEPDVVTTTSAEIYRNVRKIPATSNLTRKSFKPKTTKQFIRYSVKKDSKESVRKRKIKTINKSTDTFVSNSKQKRKQKSCKFPSSLSFENTRDTFAQKPKKIVELYSNLNAKTDLQSISEENIYGMKMLHKERRNSELNERSYSNKYQTENPYPAINVTVAEKDLHNKFNEAQQQPLVQYEKPEGRYDEYETSMKNYEMPTISSRMRQSSRSYVTRFDFKSIPFVAAKSITPSHNLGLNIQQVLSIIKSRQPSSGISPTLAHNMGLAAEQSLEGGYDGRVSTLMSRLNSRQNVCKPLPCTLLKQASTFVNSQLTDMPQEGTEAQSQLQIISPRINTSLPIQGRDACSGDGLDDRIRTEWDQCISPTRNRQERCTCYPQKCMTNERILNQCGEKVQSVPYSRNSFRNQYNRQNSCLTINNLYRKPCNKGPLVSVPEEELPQCSDYEITTKIKNLRDVLVRLHDDFSHMTEKYEKLQKSLNESSKNDKKTLKLLGEMEKELQAKEEEITVVVSLYKEVTTLKEQIKMLRNRVSRSSMITTTTDGGCFRSRNTTSQRLTRLLRQIQNFQDALKST